MQAIHRITATISAQLHAFVDQIENHEAVAAAAIEDIQKAIHEARFQVRRVASERSRLITRQEQLKKDQELWKERALRSHGTDKDRALACVSRLQRVENEIQGVEKRIEEYLALEQQLKSDLGRIEGRFEELKKRQAELAARASRAEAMAIVRLHENESRGELGGVFERWERSVLKSETSAGDPCGLETEEKDSLAVILSEEEARTSCEERLESLIQSHSQSHSQAPKK